MKPRYRPGKVTTGGRSARSVISKSKMLSSSQMDHLRSEKPLPKSKAGKGGRRANWDIDYEQGIQFALKKMPGRDNETWETDGIRKTPKNGR